MPTPNSQTIQFLKRGKVVTLNNVPPTRTLLEVLREDLGLTGTKEGCGEGDCGACTVVLGEAVGEKLTFKAVNSCIRMAHSVHGLALWTVEDLSPVNTASQHPAQEAMVQCHASQCGFCTPGFVMSLFGMYQNHVLQGQPITRELAQTELSGNLCRCTGYRPILDAAQQMASLPPVRLDQPAITRQLAEIQPQAPVANNPYSAYQMPGTLAELLAARAAQPQAQLVAGCTDVGLWVTKMHKQFDTVIDVSRVAELRRIEQRNGDWVIGAAATLQDALPLYFKVGQNSKLLQRALPVCRCATRARWAATSPMAPPSATRCHC
jgi:xanthine dehydrogenase small subunit